MDRSAREVLLVEDDEVIGSTLAAALMANGYLVSWAKTGAAAMDLASGTEADLVLLDLGLPDLDGAEVCRQLRRALPGSVIVILTARDEEIDVVLGLEAGADDYLIKPVRLTELLARIRAHLRRPRLQGTGGQVYVVGLLRLEVDARRAWLGDVELTLRAKEFDLLARLASEPGQTVSRESLMADVWDENWFGSTKTLDVHVASLRRKLSAAMVGLNRAGEPTLVTLRARGYRLQEEPN